MNSRGQYGNHAAQVAANGRRHYGGRHDPRSEEPVVGLAPIIPLGIAILAATSMTPEDVARAVRQIGTGFRTLHTEIMTEAGFRADPYREASGPIWEWWKITGIPVIEEWQDFQADTLGSWSTRFFMRPGAIKHWHERLAQLRDEAQKRVDLKGIAPIQPEMPLPQHLYEAGGKVAQETGKAAKKVTEEALDFVKIAKWGVVGALGIGGLFAIGSLASRMGGKKK